MSVTRKLPSFTITCAVAQVVGELEMLGHEAGLSDIAAFLGCTKETAKKYATKCIWSEKLVAYQKPYRPNRTMYVYHLGAKGRECLNTENYLIAKRSVLAARGIINE